MFLSGRIEYVFSLFHDSIIIYTIVFIYEYETNQLAINTLSGFEVFLLHTYVCGNTYISRLLRLTLSLSVQYSQYLKNIFCKRALELLWTHRKIRLQCFQKSIVKYFDGTIFNSRCQFYIFLLPKLLVPLMAFDIRQGVFFSTINDIWLLDIRWIDMHSTWPYADIFHWFSQVWKMSF